MSAMKGPTSKQIEFARWLSKLNDPDGHEDRGTLAALRRGLMLEDEQLFELYGYIPPRYLSSSYLGDERLYLMVAALYAYHPASFPELDLQKRRRNLGESLRLFAEYKRQGEKQGAGDGDEEDLLPEPLKRRMDALLSAPRADLFGHLRQVVSLLKTGEVPVDWAQLLYDLQHWESPEREVQWRWSRSFYVGYANQGGDQSDVR